MQPAPSTAAEGPVPIPLFRSPPPREPGTQESLSPLGAARLHGVQLCDGDALLFQQFDKNIQKLLATRIAVYLMTFLIVTVAWAAHTRYGVCLGLPLSA